VEEAVNGAEALRAIESDCPDLVLCDWNMPEMNGIELLKELKKADCPAKFGFVTSEGTSDMRQEASENGALFLITKPFTADTFCDELGSILG
jgi:two-component system chemotaxis response regulator CheY